MTKLTTDEYFRIIKQNHKKYLEQNMITHLELTGGLENAELIKQYAENIGFYRPSKERYLNNAIKQLSTTDKVGHGALAALLGIGAGGLALYAQNGVSTNVINPLAGVQNATAGAFSAVLGAGVSYLAYQAWQHQAKNAAGDDFEQFQSSMKEAGFTDKKYSELSAELVKLFHFRESILLGLTDNSGVNMREEFKKKYSPNGAPFDDQALNKAIEVYFLDELNQLFNNAFQDIYDIHDKEIQEDINNPMTAWIKSYFENPIDRQKFTQQMQLQFMDQCLNYLEAEMSEPGFFVKYSLATASVGGLIGGAIALGVAAAILGGPITLGIAAIGLVVTCLTAAAIYFTVNNIESLQFKRGKENRDAIKETIENVTKESERLSQLIKNVVETTPEDISLLAKYKDEGANKGFLNYFNLFGKTKEVAMGAGTAWVREHASRYRHSKAIEIDLSAEHKAIIGNADKQTKEMQDYLIDTIKTGKPNKFKQFINDTKEYLKNSDNQDFIQKFDVVDKIKQQILDIVAVVPANMEKPLPEELLAFYTLPVEKGGLGGIAHDLNQVRKLAPVVTEDLALDESHPYNHILVTAQRFNFALTQDKNRDFILSGDTTYRGMIGLRVDASNDRIENKINAGNIQHFLNNSFDFLYSLNKRINLDETKANLDRPIENSSEFVLYRTLLIKQLASLADPNNLRVEPSVKRDIEKFAREKLQIDPKVVFNEVLNQALFTQNDTTGPSIKDPLGVNRSINNIEQVAQAIRVDLTHVSKPVSPRMLISLEAKNYLAKQQTNKNTIFCYQNTTTELVAGELIPEANAEYLTKLKQTIETTKAFITEMADKSVLKKSGALASYIHDAHQEVINLRQQIDKLDKVLGKETKTFNSPLLKTADQLLSEYQSELEDILNIKKSENAELFDSVVQFGGFGKKKAIDLNEYDDWETVELPKPVEISDEQLNDVSKEIESCLEVLKKEPDIFMLDFINFSKSAKIKATDALKTAISDLQSGKAVDLQFLDNKIYTTDTLKTLITTITEKFGIKNIKDLFSLYLEPNPNKVPKIEEEANIPIIEGTGAVVTVEQPQPSPKTLEDSWIVIPQINVEPTKAELAPPTKALEESWVVIPQINMELTKAELAPPTKTLEESWVVTPQINMELTKAELAPPTKALEDSWVEIQPQNNGETTKVEIAPAQAPNKDLSESWVNIEPQNKVQAAKAIIKALKEPLLEENQQLNEFIKSIDNYLEQLKTEPEINKLNFFNFSKESKKKAAEELKTAIIALQAGQSVDVDFLNDKIYSNGRLKTLVDDNVNKLGINNIQELFTERASLVI